MLYTSDIIYNGRNYFKDIVLKGQSLEKAMNVILTFICQYNEAIMFNCIDFKKLGIDKCEFEVLVPSDKMCTLINAIIAREDQIILELGILSKYVTKLPTATSGTGSVKVSSTDQLGFLADKITTIQSGCIEKTASEIKFVGFIPKYGVLMMDSRGLSKFETNGLGKVGTDCEPFAISDGRNNTTNRLGRFPRWAADIANLTALGSESFTVSITNIASFQEAIGGSIGAADYSPSYPSIEVVQVGVDNTNQTINIAIPTSFGSTGNFPVTDSAHTHTHTLAINHVNTDPIPIPLLPLYIDEVPIMRIK